MRSYNVDNGINKKALFKMKTEPYLKPISDLGVGFYNLDENKIGRASCRERV